MDRTLLVVTVIVAVVGTGVLVAPAEQVATGVGPIERAGTAPEGSTAFAHPTVAGFHSLPADGAAHSAATSTAGSVAQPETDDTVTRIRVFENGSARWTIDIRTRLRTDDDVENFQTFQQRFRENTSAYLDPFAERMRNVVANAANATGRQMEATDFTAETFVQEVPRRWGVVSFSFRWTNFAATDGEALVVGDVFQGGFLLSENDTLVVDGPDGYRIADIAPQPASTEGTSATWEGRLDFADSRPHVRFEPARSPTATDTTAPPAGDGSSTSLVGLAVAALLTVGAGAWLYRRRRREGGGAVARTGSGDDGPAAASTGAIEDESVKTDPERVEELLAANGGRMRQADVADALDWSASKTSRVLSDMVDDDRIEKLRIGRENLVELVDEEE